jgi:CDP-paratose 2-epimerase
VTVFSAACEKPVLVTGGAGFIGSNLADRLASDGHDVVIYDALLRPGVEANLDWLRRRHGQRIRAVVADVRDAGTLEREVSQAAAVFHLAAQVAVTTSLLDPLGDYEVNLRATITVLEASRAAGGIPVIFASTNKVYGDLADIELQEDGDAYMPWDASLRCCGISEDRPLSFHTPYGCSKGAADQYVLDYARSFGVPSCVFRMSCIYGPRQMGTEDQGWLAHFMIQMFGGKPISIYGNGRQVRDVMFVGDAVSAYIASWRRIGKVSGQAFNLGGGPANAVTLLQVIEAIEHVAGRRANVTFEDWRPGDQRYFVADSRRAASALDLVPPTAWRDGLRSLADWLSPRGESFAAD